MATFYPTANTLIPGATSLPGRFYTSAEIYDLEQGRIFYRYYTIFPNLLLSLHPDYVMAHTLWPIQPDETHIICEWLFSPQAEGAEGFDPDDAVRFWDMTNRQDWQVCELTQQGVSSRAYTPAPYSPAESLLAAFDRELLNALGET